MKKKLHLAVKSKYVKCAGISLGVLLVGALLFSPSVHQETGNTFFGDVPELYNIRLAQFFFKRSAYPIFGAAVPYAHYQLGRTYFIQGDLLASQMEMEKELALYPEDKRTYYMLGLTYGFLGEEEKAIDAFGKFIEWKPGEWAARNDRAWLQFRIGDIDGALSTIQPATSDKFNPWVQNTYGTLLLNKKEYENARQAFVYAQNVADTMTEDMWGRAYPGNDPRIYDTGLSAMRNSIKSNLQLAEKKLQKDK